MTVMELRKTGAVRRPDPDEDSIPLQRVLVVEEHKLVAAGLRAILAEAPWVGSCLVADTAEDAMQVVRRHHPQIVLVSTTLGGWAGPDLCRTLREQVPHIKVVLMFGDGRVPAALAASLGTVAALSKLLAPGAIVMAIKHVAEGGRVFPKGQAAHHVKLSSREMEVLVHLSSGMSNPETAARLKLSRHTIKQHTSAVYRKLGVRNRAEAASRAQELGLIGWQTRELGLAHA
ncbi:response regulator transcription factor [Nocardioides ginsengisoli]|uniref:LuxR C-terminal-related transcriptional regulator n=1 Tax=Nocardioides ginsengisoli TaxID=363868 RepID=A0ABW3VX63_9ACTN